MKISVISKIIVVFLLSVGAYASDFNDKSGDALQILLPAAAFSATFYNGDSDGRVEFYKSFFTNAAVSYGLKESVDKERPDHSGNDSFPSGHTSMAFQSAVFLQQRYGYEYGVPAILLAAYTGYTRVEADDHDWTDVAAGAAIGAASALFFTTEFMGGKVTPILDGKTAGVNFTKKF